MPLKLMYITNDADVARIAQDAGVDRIFVDLERLGKGERQGHLDSVRSDHCLEDITALRPVVRRAELLVRVNPINSESKKEINSVIRNGADIVMLPMFKSAREAEKFIEYVAGRAKTVLLLETLEAEKSIDEILEVPGTDEIYIGLNDLHLAHGRKFMFELLADGTVERLCEKLSSKSVPYGFGGTAAPGSGALPAERIIAEHYRLGSSSVILSRSFCKTSPKPDLSAVERVFRKGVSDIRELESSLPDMPEAFFSENRNEVARLVAAIIESLKKE